MGLTTGKRWIEEKHGGWKSDHKMFLPQNPNKQYLTESFVEQYALLRN